MKHLDIVYVRKIAQIALRDGESGARELAARVLAARNPRKRDTRALEVWMRGWIETVCNRSGLHTETRPDETPV
jgi:hypothetical protein